MPSGHRKYRSRAPVIVGSNPTRPTIAPDEREDQEHRLPRCEGLATLAQGQHNRKSEIWLVLPKKSANWSCDNIDRVLQLVRKRKMTKAGLKVLPTDLTRRLKKAE